MRSNFCFPRLLMASFAVPTTSRPKPIFFKNVRNRSCRPGSSSTTNTVGWPCLSWCRMSRSREDFLTRQRPSDLNGRNLSALYEIVDSWNRNPQVLGRLFYGKQIVNWSFAHSFGRRFHHYIIYENRSADLNEKANLAF